MPAKWRKTLVCTNHGNVLWNGKRLICAYCGGDMTQGIHRFFNKIKAMPDYSIEKIKERK